MQMPLKTQSSICQFNFPWKAGQTKEATEISSDPEGRWFSFHIDVNAILLMEKKGMPNHLQSLPCVDSPTDLSTIIRELEDAGEARIGKRYEKVL